MFKRKSHKSHSSLTSGRKGGATCYDDLKTGRLKPVDSEEEFARLRKKSNERRLRRSRSLGIGMPPHFFSGDTSAESPGVGRRARSTARADDPMKFMVSKAGLKMCLWYGMLYVVVEGWRDVGLSDPEIDRLLASPNTELLRHFRNGMFHFQKDQWLPPKLSNFLAPSNQTVEWVRALTAEFRRYLMAEMKKLSV